MATDRRTLFGLRRDSASITLVALCMTTALGLGLGSYLTLCSRSAQFSSRNANREKARLLADTGIEEALWALNQDNWTSSGPNNNTTWTTSGNDRTISLTYSLPGSALTGTVAVTVANYAIKGPTWPTITVNATISGDDNPPYTKSLRATTGPLPLFGNAIASSESYVSFVAGGTVDSWNSDSDNNPATAGFVPYSFVSGNANNYAAVVAGRGNGTNGVLLQQATVRGYVATQGLPVGYSVSGSPKAKVCGPNTDPDINVDTARLGKSAFIPSTSEFKITLPTISGSSFNLLQALLEALGGVLNIPAHVNTSKLSRDLTIDPLSLTNPSSMIINGRIQMIVDGDLTIRNGGKITITANGSLELFVTGNVAIGGNGIRNETNAPKNFVLYSTATSASTAITYTASGAFCGVIYSENKPIDIKENGPFYGALLSRQYVRFSGSATNPVFHYDLALRQTRFSGVTTPYRVTQLTEL